MVLGMQKWHQRTEDTLHRCPNSAKGFPRAQECSGDTRVPGNVFWTFSNHLQKPHKCCSTSFYRKSKSAWVTCIAMKRSEDLKILLKWLCRFSPIPPHAPQEHIKPWLLSTYSVPDSASGTGCTYVEFMGWWERQPLTSNDENLWVRLWGKVQGTWREKTGET